MLRFAPFLLILLYSVLMYHFSARRSARELKANSKRLRDPLLQPFLDRMARALGVDEIYVNVYNVDPINGLAAADGQIYITRGFLNRYREGVVSAAELSSVFAHELGHVALGHTRRRMIDFSGQNAARMVLATILNRFLPGIGGWLATMIGSLLMARLSRKDEFEADEYASALLIKSGIGTEGQKSLFKKLDSLTGGVGGTPAWFLSHPRAEERIAAIEKNERNWATLDA
jgi:putative metalloprotease